MQFVKQKLFKLEDNTHLQYVDQPLDNKAVIDFVDLMRTSNMFYIETGEMYDIVRILPFTEGEEYVEGAFKIIIFCRENPISLMDSDELNYNFDGGISTPETREIPSGGHGILQYNANTRRWEIGSISTDSYFNIELNS